MLVLGSLHAFSQSGINQLAKLRLHDEMHTLRGFPGPVEVVLLGGMILRWLVVLEDNGIGWFELMRKRCDELALEGIYDFTS